MRHETPRWAGRKTPAGLSSPHSVALGQEDFSEQQPHPEPWDEEEAPEDVFLYSFW